MHEIDVALTAHELVKVRVFSDERAERDAMLVRICDALDCAAVQQIGKLLVLWRPRAAAEAAEPASHRASPGRAREGRRRGARPSSKGLAPATRRPGPRTRAVRLAAARRTTPAPPFGGSGRAPESVTSGKAPPGVPRAAGTRAFGAGSSRPAFRARCAAASPRAPRGGEPERQILSTTRSQV